MIESTLHPRLAMTLSVTLAMTLSVTRCVQGTANLSGYTALHDAAMNGSKEMVKMLLDDVRMNANAVTKEGHTILHKAVSPPLSMALQSEAVPLFLARSGVAKDAISTAPSCILLAMRDSPSI